MNPAAKRPGRPASSETPRLRPRIDAALYARLVAAADADGRSTTDAVAWAIRQYVESVERRGESPESVAAAVEAGVTARP